MPSVAHIRTDHLKRVVIKIGSNVLTDKKGIKKGFLSHLAEQILFLKNKKIQAAIVSSGAISAGMSLFQRTLKPATIEEKQALAAIGQPVLMNRYAAAFEKKHLKVAQVLLTQDGLENRTRFLNARHTLDQLFKMDIIPVINENDTVAVDEIKIGDNDQLSAHVSHLIGTDLLIILSHVEGLYNKDPRRHADATLIPVVPKIDNGIWSCIYHSKDHRTTGGMTTKIHSAKIATSFGIPVAITSGMKKNFIKNIFSHEFRGTFFPAGKERLKARKHWISSVQRPKGQVAVDEGAEQALVSGKKSLLPTGIVAVMGSFAVGDCVEIVNRQKKKLGKGLTSYSSIEIEKVMGHKTGEIKKILGYKYADEIVHRNDMVLENQQ